MTSANAARNEGDSIQYVQTRDGAHIACKRRPQPDATPVLFLHGLAANVNLWDIPTLTCEDGEFVSLPAMMHQQGHDVWLMNLRGHGEPNFFSQPPAEQTDWCVDHFIHYDLPAVLEHVYAQTGRRPFVIGNSMGAMTTAAYLQGAVLAESDAGAQIVADAEAARVRQQQVAGAVLVEFPAALRWPRSLYDEQGRLKWNDLLAQWRNTDSDANYPFEVLSRVNWLQAVLQATGQVRLDWLRPKPERLFWWRSLPAPLADVFERMDQAFLQGARRFAERFKGTQLFDPETFRQGLLPAADHMKTGVLMQMAASVRAGAFVSSLATPAYAYSDHYDAIELPVLVIVGGEDRIANADVTREAFFEQIRSTDKTFLLFDSYAHGDFEYAPAACRDIYPPVLQWIAERDNSAAPA